MTLDEFVKKYNRSKVDYDGYYGAQCVDLFRQYCADVLQIPHTGGVVGASELYTKYDVLPKERQYFERIAYTGELPRKGDVVIFAPSKTNKYGHVAIVLDADKFVITVFEQDGFAQTGARIAQWGYRRAMGFLRAR